jgi:hypothetical protein
MAALVSKIQPPKADAEIKDDNKSNHSGSEAGDGQDGTQQESSETVADGSSAQPESSGIRDKQYTGSAPGSAPATSPDTVNPTEDKEAKTELDSTEMPTSSNDSQRTSEPAEEEAAATVTVEEVEEKESNSAEVEPQSKDVSEDKSPVLFEVESVSSDNSSISPSQANNETGKEDTDDAGKQDTVISEDTELQAPALKHSSSKATTVSDEEDGNESGSTSESSFEWIA